MNKNMLTKQLYTMQQIATSQTDAYQSARDQLYQNIVDAYIWWGHAVKEGSYLNNKYKSAGIAYRKPANSNMPNFYPLVRLIWNIDVTKKASTVSNWARSLQSIHILVTNEPERFSADPRNELINYVRDMGGLSQLRGEAEMSEDDLIAEETGALGLVAPKPAKTAKASVEPYAAQIAYVKNVTEHVKLPAFATAYANDNDLVLMLARRKAGTGELEVVGTNNDDALINAALDGCSNMDRRALDESLRLIVEALTPHAFPAKLEKYRKTFFTKRKKLGDKQVKENTTLFVDPAAQELVVTKTPECVSAVTRVKPKNWALHSGNAVRLRGADRYWIETQLIAANKLVAYSATPSNALQADTSDLVADYCLKLDNGEQTRTIYFYEADKMVNGGFDTYQLPEFDHSALQWELTASAHWLYDLAIKCVGEWLEGVKSHFNKARNKRIGFEVSNTQLTVHWWWDTDAQQYLKQHATSFGDEASIVMHALTSLFDVNPKDAMVLLAAIPSLPLSNDTITLKSDGTSLLLEYETDLATYVSQIPSSLVYEDFAAMKEDEAKAEKEQRKAEKKEGKANKVQQPKEA